MLRLNSNIWQPCWTSCQMTIGIRPKISAAVLAGGKQLAHTGDRDSAAQPVVNISYKDDTSNKSNKSAAIHV